MSKILKSTGILVAITLLAGLALAAVYEGTREPIAAAEKAAEEAAYLSVMPDGTRFVAFGNGEAAWYPVEVENGVTVNKCLTAVDADGNSAGHVVNVTSPNGYGGDVTVAVGILQDGTIYGVSVISQSETAGLGAVCAKASFTNQFQGIVGAVSYVKDGKTEPNEIDAISGATITTKAVTEAVNAAVAYAEQMRGGKQP